MSHPRSPIEAPWNALWRVRARHTALAAAAALALLAAGCGPGTGGTGDGEGQSVLGAFGASTAGLCTSAINDALACAPGSAQAPDMQQGTSMVFFSDTAAGNNVAVRIQDNHLQLAARCQNLQFEGDWGIVALNDARFFGTYTASATPTPTLATLTVQSAGVNAELVALLRDASGLLLLGPVLLQRVAAPVTNPAACPG